MVFPQIKVTEIRADPDDNAVLECGVEAQADYIITGDPHLLDLEDFQGIRIVTPAAFVTEYLTGDKGIG